MSSSLSVRLEASNYWIRNSIFINQRDIVLFENETKRYTLVPDQDLLEHEEEANPGYDFFTITWNPDSNPEETTNIFTYEEGGGDDSVVPVVTDPDTFQTRVFSMRSKTLEAPLPCVFVALGWLREKDLPSISEGGMQTTYYVVLLNLSTDPVSVWLMFDYHLEADDECRFRWTNRLGDYHNRGWVGEFVKGRRLPKLDDRFPAPSGDETRVHHFLDQNSNLKPPLLPQPDVDHTFVHPSEPSTPSVPQGDSLSHNR
ncbi:MAG: hypothetical protein Q9210_001946 [Variospora velana]